MDPFRRTVLVVVWLVACTPSPEPPDPAHAAEVAAWREARIERLTAPTGWLTLVGLDWLAPGDNSVGSEVGATVVLPKRLPPRVGVLRYDASGAEPRIVFVPAAGSGLDAEGAPLDAPIEMRPDSTGAPTTLHRDGVRFFVIERGGRYGVRVKDEQSAVRRDFVGIDAFEVDSSWRVVARVERYDPPRRVAIPNVLGGSFEETIIGVATFERSGRTHRLELQAEAGDAEAFVVFGDATNRRETYGAGRFLTAALDAAAGTAVLDFNRAYNPPCAFTPYATCPLPPTQNVLALEVRAGEKRYGKGH